MKKKQVSYELREEYDLSKMTVLLRGRFALKTVQIKSVRFEENTLHILLSDGREISLPIAQMNWLKWLANATPEQRSKWTIEPGGFAVYWEELDDGFEIEHLLSLQPLA
ncbi:MAG TPA: DUF2442 domain-containing protein [Anaerolineales bacterium]